MLTLVAACGLSYSSMVALCQGLKRHQVAVWGRPWASHWHRVLRLYGWLALPLSLFLSAQVWGWAIGSVGVFGLWSMSAFILALGLAYWPRTLVSLGALGSVVGLIGLAYSLWF